ncbi:MAG: dockerin [Deltaproteobacteria bacterium]
MAGAAGQNTGGSAGQMASAGSSGSGGSGQEVTGPLPLAGAPTASWDFTGIIGTGQSLSVGAQAGTPTPKATMQPHNNLKLALNGVLVPPFDPAAAALSLVPLVEPIRPIDNGYPSAYPVNLDGESPHTAMSVQLTAAAQAGGLSDFVTIHTVVGESGQPMTVINKTATENATGTMGRAYAASLFEARAIKRLVGEKSYGIGAIFLTHGESDAGNANYANDMLQLWTDYNADLKAITGQTQDIPLFTSQQHGIYMYAAGQADRNIDVSTKLQWTASLDHPGQIVCTGPKYQYPYFTDFLHLVPLGYELMGEKYAEVFYQHVLLGRPWKPLQPLAPTLTRSGPVITVDFYVPVPPLAWDDVLPKPHQADLMEWAQGRGFEVRTAGQGSTPLTIQSVELLDQDTVQITCTTDVPAGATLGYAATSDGAAISGVSPRWGQLKDSDPFVGELTQMVQANYAVAFELPVP